jgi:hypothetical protein
MRSRLVLFTLSLFLALATLGCTSKPSTNSAADNSASGGSSGSAPGGASTGSPSGTSTGNPTGTAASGNSAMAASNNSATPAPKPPIVVPAGTSVTVSLGSALGSKLSQPGQTFTGTVAKDILVGTAVAIPKGATVSGTVTDAKPLGKMAGEAVLQVRLDSITLNGASLQVQSALRTFSVKGKGKRTGVMAGGGAALGGIIGGLAGGGKGAAIGLLAGGGAGAGGAALTGNKDVVLPVESAVSFQITQPVEIKQ